MPVRGMHTMVLLVAASAWLASVSAAADITLLFRGVASNQWSDCLDRDVVHTLRRDGAALFARIPGVRVVAGEHGEDIDIAPQDALGAVLTIVRAGRIDYHTVSGIRPKYFLALSCDIFDPVSGYMLASFPRLGLADPACTVQELTPTHDRQCYAELVYGLTNAVWSDVLASFQPALVTVEARRGADGRYRVDRPRARGLGLNDVLYDHDGKPYALAAITNQAGIILPVEHAGPATPTVALYSKRLFAQQTTYWPARLQVLMVDVPRDCPDAIHPAVDADDVEVSGTIKLHTALAADKRVPLLYPAPLGAETKLALRALANRALRDTKEFTQKRSRPDYVVIGRVLTATHRRLMQDGGKHAHDYFRVVVAADVCDVFQQVQPVLTCVAEADFAELATQFKVVHPRGVFTSLAQTAFEKAGRALLEALWRQTMQPPSHGFGGVQGLSSSGVDGMSAAQLVYASVTLANQPPRLRLAYPEAVRTRVYQRASMYFTDASYYASEEYRAALMEQMLAARKLQPPATLVMQFTTARVRGTSLAAAGKLQCVRNAREVWAIPIQGERKVEADADEELRRLVYDMCEVIGKKFKTSDIR